MRRRKFFHRVLGLFGSVFALAASKPIEKETRVRFYDAGRGSTLIALEGAWPDSVQYWDHEAQRWVRVAPVGSGALESNPFVRSMRRGSKP